jgi:hypothetical protein
MSRATGNKQVFALDTERSQKCLVEMDEDL